MKLLVIFTGLLLMTTDLVVVSPPGPWSWHSLHHGRCLVQSTVRVKVLVHFYFNKLNCWRILHHTYVGVDGSQSSIVGLFEGIYGCTSHSADHIIITWLKMTVAPMFWSVHSCELEPQVVGACVYCGPTCYRLRWFNTRVTCQQLPRTVCLKNHILLRYFDILQLNQTNT